MLKQAGGNLEQHLFEMYFACFGGSSGNKCQYQQQRHINV